MGHNAGPRLLTRAYHSNGIQVRVTVVNEPTKIDSCIMSNQWLPTAWSDLVDAQCYRRAARSARKLEA